MMVEHAVHAIVCGSIRSHIEAWLVFNDLIAANKVGRIGRIVYCTWTDQIDKNRSFVDCLIASGVEVISTEQKLSSVFNNQVLPFYVALQTFSDDDIVVRLRTDKCFPLVRSLLVDRDVLVSRCLDERGNNLFHGKVVVPALSLNEFFAHADFFMLSQAKNLRTMCHMDAYFDLFCLDVGAEARWFVRPFIHKYPDVRLVFESFSILKLSEAIYRWATSSPFAGDDAMPQGLSRFLGRYIYLLACNFAVMGDLPACDATVAKILGGADPLRWEWRPRVFTASQKWLDQCLKGNRQGFLEAAISEAANSDLERTSLMKSDISEIHAFIETFWRQPSKSPWPGRPVVPVSVGTPSMSTQERIWFKQMLFEIARSIEPQFEKLFISEKMINLSIKIEAYGAGTFNQFSFLCRDLGIAAVAILQEDFGENVPPNALIIPALFFTASLVFSWDSTSGQWLADHLLDGTISTHFAEITRWGLSARFWNQPGSVAYKAAMLMLKGLGGPVLLDDAIRLLQHASENGNLEAGKVLEHLNNGTLGGGQTS